MPPLADLSDEELWYWMRLMGARVQALLEAFKTRYPQVHEFQIDLWQQMRVRDGWASTEKQLERWKQTQTGRSTD